MACSEQHEGRREALILSAFSLISYLTLYALNLLLARTLSLEEFNDYNVGVSALLVMAALAPLGLEKFALKVIPVYKQHREWANLRGFLRFAIYVATCVSLLLALTFDIILESVLLLRHEGLHIAIPMIVGCLPVLSVFFVLLEVATANGAPLSAAALYRVVLPFLLLGTNVAVWKFTSSVSGLSAGWCFGASWLCVTVSMWRLAFAWVPKQVQEVTPAFHGKSWLRESTPLLLTGLLLTVITQSGVIVLELSDSFHAESSVFAVAMQTGGFVVLLTTSTNRFYLPQISMFLDQQDQAGLVRLRGQRLIIIGTMAAAFVVFVFLFGRTVLRFFGEDFVGGYPATCVVAIGAAISTTFSLAPIGLQFAGYHQYVLRCTALATVTSVVMCIVLANLYGTLGAALAYAVPLSILYLHLAVVALRRLKNDVKLSDQ